MPAHPDVPGWLLVRLRERFGDDFPTDVERRRRGVPPYDTRYRGGFPPTFLQKFKKLLFEDF